VLPLAALIGSLVRWLMQGSGNVYTALDKRFYVPDPDLPLGWRISPQHPIWLGLEVCLAIVVIVIAVAVGGWMIRKREAKRGRPAILMRIGSWLVAVVPLVVPVAAFQSGPGPTGGRDMLPSEIAGLTSESGIAGSLAVPAGKFAIVQHAGTSITAQLKSGGEAFDAVFAGDIRGAWQGDPHDVTKPMTAEVSVAAASVDTGVGKRSEHAREGYLLADQYPRITFELGKVVEAHQDGADKIAFRAKGKLGLVGKTHVVEIDGTLRKPDPATLGRLNLTGDVLLVKANFSIVISESALAADAGDFDGDHIPIKVSLVLNRSRP